MKKIENPISLFKKWYKKELELTNVRIPSAVCLSTVGIDNFPNARFMSFKELVNDSFIITGPLNSRKGIEIDNNNNVSLTFWWTETERQIRVQGIATKIEDKIAEKYFAERNANSKAVSLICEQGKEVNDLNLLKDKILEKIAQKERIDRPKDWSGFLIKPLRIEFMEFKKTRFHDRKLYELEKDKWNMKQIQP